MKNLWSIALTLVLGVFVGYIIGMLDRPGSPTERRMTITYPSEKGRESEQLIFTKDVQRARPDDWLLIENEVSYYGRAVK